MCWKVRYNTFFEISIGIDFKMNDKKKNIKKPVFFITGTNTGVGKTFVTCAMLQTISAWGLTTAAMKPVSAGVIETESGGMVEDVVALSTAMTATLPMEIMNPFSLKSPISPNIAAEKEGVTLNVAALLEKTTLFLNQPEDVLLLEGAGGWAVPLNEHELLADYVEALQIPVIVVVGITLGCLNHTLLTVKDIQSRDVPLAGWIANQIDPDMQAYHDNIQTLKDRITAPLLATIPYQLSLDYKHCGHYFSSQLSLLIR